ncbi:hypothetical protein K7432_001365 [Basidiobolus ranarum]|uniref:Uncharacterized protein n=1 Tax=Basidiobolus ranarum TaxID=34480 RepID=A0ABR2W9T6_9FUNG
MKMLHSSMCLLLVSTYLGHIEGHVARAHTSQATNVDFHQLMRSGGNMGGLSKRELAEVELSEFQDPIRFGKGSLFNGFRRKVRQVVAIFLHMRVREFLKVVGLGRIAGKLETYSGIKKRDLNEVNLSEEESELLKSYTHGLKKIFKNIDFKQFLPLLQKFGPGILDMKVSDLLNKAGIHIPASNYKGAVERRSLKKESFGKTLARLGASFGPAVLTGTAKGVLGTFASLFGGSYSGVSKLLDPLTNVLTKAILSSGKGTKPASEPVPVQEDA